MYNYLNGVMKFHRALFANNKLHYRDGNNGNRATDRRAGLTANASASVILATPLVFARPVIRRYPKFRGPAHFVNSHYYAVVIRLYFTGVINVKPPRPQYEPSRHCSVECRPKDVYQRSSINLSLNKEKKKKKKEKKEKCDIDLLFLKDSAHFRYFFLRDNEHYRSFVDNISERPFVITSIKIERCSN
ncbi:hypothetical protein PUN28_016832 [Cardiocondyla obscurior]|uniref:Uncharacterized protein n=1 Tax=Cardiocondyla obscurior TaxID=286306 RepID=A0AAW2ESN0_9HYME